MSKRSLVMLAEEYNPLKFKAEGSYMSEKLDGVRALWLPFTRGWHFKKIPWANTKRDDRNYTCSGLWTRRGKPILAPEWWLNGLPINCPLDGELFAGRGNFQKVTSTVRKLEPDSGEWSDIVYKVFDIPNYIALFSTGQIREGGQSGQPAYEVYFRSVWLDLWPELKESPHFNYRRFNETYNYLCNKVDLGDHAIPLYQRQLPSTREAAENAVNELLTTVTEAKGEGVMLRRGHSIWEPKRSQDLVKVKKLRDSEATICGYVFGEGKYQGMVGAFRVEWQHSGEVVTFDLSGFTDAERQVNVMQWNFANANPGVFTKANVSEQFPIGSVVTFAYNELTNDGIPRFARYLRRAVPT